MSLSLTLSIYYLSMIEDFSMIEHKTIELAEYIVCVMKSLIHITTDHKSPIRLPCWLSLSLSLQQRRLRELECCTRAAKMKR